MFASRLLSLRLLGRSPIPSRPLPVQAVNRCSVLVDQLLGLGTIVLLVYRLV